MKVLKRLLTLCALVVGMGGIPSVMAADADAPAAKPVLKGDAICTRCHDESENRPILSLYQTPHGVRGDARAPNCQSCHGESTNHLGGNVAGKGRPKPDRIFGTKKSSAGYAPNTPVEQSEACLTCHKSGLRTHWDGSQHQANDVPCASCHRVHIAKDPVLVKSTQSEVCFACHKEQRAETHKVSTHPLDAGKIACSDCHNPHGSPGPKLLKKNTVVETCYTCHAEKRGPFLWEHRPVVEDCTNCHTPHGSNLTPLLKSRAPLLCDGCHDGPHASPSIAGPNMAGKQAGVTGTISENYVGRGCMNCHVMVHGSNSPAGGYLQR